MPPTSCSPSEPALPCQTDPDHPGRGHRKRRILTTTRSRIPALQHRIHSGVVNNLEDSALAQAIIELGHTLRLQTVAEGVEASEQASQLRRLQCELGQGFYFAQALDADQVAALLDGQSLTVPIAVSTRAGHLAMPRYGP